MRLAAALSIRAGEARIVTLLAALFATVEAGRGLGEVGADTLFLSRFGADALPYLFVLLGAVSLVAALAYGVGIGRLGRRRFLVGLLVFLSLLLLAERAALVGGSELALPVIWLSVYAVGALLLTVVWTVAGSTLDVRQAKRLFPVCTSAAILGGFAGTLSAGPLSRIIGTDNLLLLYVALLGASAALTAATLGGSRPSQHVAPGTLAAELRTGFDYVRRSPLMRFVALAYLLFAVLMFSVSFPFLRAMGEAFDSEADLATALGLLSAAVTGVSFLLSISVANRLYARVGLMGAAILLPLVYAAGFGLWLVGFSLSTAMVVRFAQQVTQRGISNAAWSALYNVVPSARRPQVLAFMDGVPGQIGIALSGVLLLVAGAFMTEGQIFVMGALVAVASCLVVLSVRARYGQALVATLRSGLAEQVLEGGPGLAALAREPRVLPELRRALADADAGARRLAADLLGRLGATEDAGALVPCLRDGDPEVRLAAVRSIAALDGRVIAAQRDALAADPSPGVRAELAVALATTGDSHGRAILDGLLRSATAADRIAALDGYGRIGGHACLAAGRDGYRDPHPAVRAAAVRALGVLGEREGDVSLLLLSALGDDSDGVRRAASAALRSRPSATTALLSVLANGPEQAQIAALDALDGSRDEVRAALRGWVVSLVERATALRSAVSGGPAEPGTTSELLAFVVRHRERQIEDRVLAAVAVLGAPEANGPIRRALRSQDPETRAQAVEALDALGDSQVARAVVELLETDPQAPRGSDTAVGALHDDPDPWIRGLALRTARERDRRAGAIIGERVAADPDPVLKLLAGSADAAGGDVPESERTLGEIERMLFLRRVSLFSRLAPEDLQRIAAAAIERVYAPDEALVREGELGDELVVIVEGDVRVVRGSGATARLIRTYAAGDHIGELAVLREQPRAATVIAGSQGVRGLVIGGDGLMAILRERPDAAMAMLATLADRISSQ